MAAAEGFAALQSQVRGLMERHHPDVARWDRDMTAEAAEAADGGGGGGGGGSEGVLPTLRAAEDTLLRAEGQCARVDRLLQLQERYRQDSAGLQARVRALYDAVADEDASQTDIRRQQMHERAQAVFGSVKRLKDRVRKAQGAYASAGISLAASMGGGGGAGGAEEGLSELRAQVRKLGGRLHRLRYHLEEEEEARQEGAAAGHMEGDEEEEEDEKEDEEEPPPPTRSAAT